MIIETLLYRYTCSKCGHIWESETKMSKPLCKKCLEENEDDLIDYHDYDNFGGSDYPNFPFV